MITLEANYSKKIGLPQYSSHQFSITLKSELTDVSQVEQESARLYDVLQNSVDQNIQKVGFLPISNGNENGHDNNGKGHSATNGDGDVWKCSPKQKELILKIVDENRLDKNEVETLAKERFNVPVKSRHPLAIGVMMMKALRQREIF